METEIFYVCQFVKMLFKAGLMTGLIVVPVLLAIKAMYLLFLFLNHKISK